MRKLTLKEVLLKYESGNCTDEEKAIVETFYLQIPANDDDFLSDEQLISAVDRVGARLPVKPFAAKHHKLWPRLAGAAMLLITLSAGTYFLFKGKPKIYQTARQKTEAIRPGGNQAVLTLASGKTILLTSAKNGHLISQAGANISKNSLGQIIYVPSPPGATAKTGEISYNTLSTPLGGQYQLILPDGSHVWLNALTTIKYPTSFTGRKREVEITGEAYFEVAHDQSKPFRVKSNLQTVEVLGTHFNIMAYAGDPVIKTTLLQGSVKVSQREISKLLNPGQQAKVSDGSITLNNDVDIEDVISWKNGYFKFHEPLKDIMQKISRWYDVDVVYSSKVDKDEVYTGRMSRSRNLADLLALMEQTGNIHFQIKGRSVMVNP